MAPPDRKPEPNHPAAAGIDGAFGHVGEIAAWVEWLLHPEQHPYDRMIILEGGSKVEVTCNVPVPKSLDDPNGPLMPDPPQPIKDYPYESVIQGCYVEQFFDPALALSGQQTDDDSDLAKVYRGLNEAFWLNNGSSGRLLGGLGGLQKQWQGDASEYNGVFVGWVSDFTNMFSEIAKELSAIPLAYAAIIRRSRESLNEAMGKLVDAFNHKFYTRGTPWEKVLVKALSTIAAGALTYVTGGAAAAAFGAGFATAFDKIVDWDPGDVGGEKWREIVDHYFVAQMNILQSARDEIDKLKAQVTQLAGRMAELPVRPPAPA